LNVHINDKELLKLYETGSSKKLRLPESVIDKFFATIQKIESAISICDFWKDSGLRFEKLKGFKNRYSMRLTGKYRLEMDIEWKNTENTIGEFTLIEISSHYGD
jgi:proteic killer suppression protein